MEENKQLEGFASGSVPKAVIKNAFPAMASMVMILIYNLADTFFIGQTHDALQIAAVSMAMPVFLIFMAVGTIFGIGGTSVISRALGEKRTEYAKKVCSFCMWAGVAIGAVMMVIGLTCMTPILHIMGTTEASWDYTKSYLTIVAFSGIFSMISTTFSGILRAEGQAKKSMVGQIAGNLTNIILDPIFILWFGWGISGAAIATVIGNAVAAIYYLLYFRQKTSMLSISLKDFSMGEGIPWAVISIGVPACLSPLMMSVSQIIVNGRMAAYSDLAMAGYGVSVKVIMIITTIGLGLGQGVQPLWGYCVGARLKTRFHEEVRFTLVFGTICCVIFTGLCYIFAGNIVQAFITDPEALSYGIHFARIQLTTCAVFAFYSVFFYALQAMGAAAGSLLVNLGRQGLVFIPAVYIMESFMGVDGLVWAQPVADIVSIILAGVLYFFAAKKRVLGE